MIQILADNPLLLLFLVGAIGYPIGRIRIFGSSLGIAAVLFVGLAFGALDPNLKLPEIIYLLGLAVFVYTVGISSGPGFFASFRRQGLRDNAFVVAMLLFGAALSLAAYALLRLKPTVTAGMFTGALTNTPALAAVLDIIKTTHAGEALDQMLAEPVVGYSVVYPMGILGIIVVIALAQRLWRVDPEREAQALRDMGVAGEKLYNRTVVITRPDVSRAPLRQLAKDNDWNVVLARVRQGDTQSLVTGDTRLDVGDLVSVVGAREDIERFTAAAGEPSTVELPLDRSEIDFRRIFVSNPDVVGHRLSELDLPQKFDAVVTRVRRGDIDLLPRSDQALELGDRVRVVTYRGNMDAVSHFFGDSFKALAEIDILSFNLGLTLGLLVGLIPIPLPGGIVLKLGYAGGPLIVSLILGALRRSGPIVWQLPYNANLTLRQVGLVLFLAGVGTRAGYSFLTTLAQGGGLALFVAGAIITMVTAGLMLFIGYKVLKIPVGVLLGMLSGMQTNPAILAYSLEQTRNDLPNVGYATVYPVATIAKIVLAQLLLTLLR